MGGSPLLNIRLMGDPEVTLGDSPIQVDTRKAIAMLAYLAVEGAASRDTLTALLWPEASPERARATLRRTLSALRSGVGSEHLITGGDRVTLGGPMEIDIARFDTEIAATRNHEHDSSDVCPSCIPHLADATGLYRGDFLEGFSIGGAPEFEDWARTVGEGLRLRMGEVFNRLGTARAAIGDYTGAIAAVARWVEIDPLNEPANRLLMLLNAWAGDRPAAMEAYREFVAVLDRELGVPPLEETTELYEAILDEDLPPAPGVRRSTRAHPPKIGADANNILDREDELERLNLILESAEARGNVVTLTGDSWMGKTRLLEELMTRAEMRGYAVIAGRASRTEQTLPYGVMSQMIDRAVTALRRRDLELPNWATHELSRLIPRLAPGTRPADTDRLGDLRFLESAHEAFRCLADSGPTVMTLDNAQWLDPASARLLAFLAERSESVPLTIVLATRSGEETEPIVAEVGARSHLIIHLQPLEPRHLGGRVDPERARSIIDATGGVPLLVMEALDSDSVATPGVMRYIENRVRGLGGLARQVLTAAAVLGGISDIGLVRATSGRSDEELVGAVEELIGAGLLREVPGDDTVGFTLEAVERVIYESTSLVRRRLLHKRAALALQSLPRADEDTRIAAEVAAHFHKAGAPEAADWYRRAADLARRAYAGTEARVLYESALALGGEDDPGELHLALGELAIARGDYGAAISELRSAASRATGELLSRVEHRMGEVHRLLGRFDRAEESFARAAPDHPRPAVVYADWALLCHRTGAPDQALEMAEKALTAAKEQGDLREISRAHDILGVVQTDPEAAMEHINRALELADGSEQERMAALNNKARLLAEEGDVAAGIELVEEAMSLAEATGHRHREAALRNHLADLHHQAGREDLSREALTEAVAIFSDIDAGEWEPELWLLSHW